MMRVMEKWGISAMFFDVLLKFGDQEQVFEASSGFRQASHLANGSFELCYQLMYVEPSGRVAPRDPWSYRQTGIAHKYESETNSNLIVMLNPKESSAAQSRLEKHANSPKRERLAGHPLNVHLVILSSYLAHWQDYIESLAQALEEIQRRILVIDINVSTFEATELQKLRNTEDKIVCKACRCLSSTMQILETLFALNAALPQREASFTDECASVHRQLQLMQQRIEGHLNSAGILAQRVQATLGLLTNLLDLQNQGNSGRISSRMLHLTRESVDDNATVKVITVCTLVYLPASFMATFFGMNFFEFGTERDIIRFSPSFWVYVAATVPLTILTVGAWYMYKFRHERRKKKKRDEEEATY
jgi:Mg2+ and Co2+ transporter CorA